MLKICQFGIMRIIEPTRYRNGVIRMEDIGSRRIIDNDSFSYWSTKLRKIFDVIAFVVVTRLSEQTMFNDIVDIQLV